MADIQEWPVFRGAFHLSHRRLLWVLLLLALFIGGRTADAWLLAAGGLWLLGRLTLGAAFPRLRVRLRLARPAVFAHEWVHAEGEIANPSRWPLPWVEIESRQPEAFAGGLRRVEWLPGGAVRRLRVSWYARRRGVYRLGRLVLRGGAWFGLQRMERETPPLREVVVYPAVYPVSAVPDARRLPEGPRRDASSPFPDDLSAGVRPYRSGDGQRNIAWRASARHGALLVRDIPRVRERTTCLLLDLDRGAWYRSGAGEGTESAISLCASLICDARLGERPLALGTWAGLRTHDESGRPRDVAACPVWLAPRRGEPGRRALLRLLAALRPGEAPPFTDLLTLLAPRMPWGAQAVWVVPRDTPAVRARALLSQARGHPVTILCAERREGLQTERGAGGLLRVWEVSRDAGFHLA